MLEVNSLSQFDFFNNFRLCAGRTGLHRTISNVVILDYEGINMDFSDFNMGDFVITNLMFAKENPDLIYPAFKALMDKEVSCIAIKDVFFTQLPFEVMEMAENQKVPIFFFNSIYIEDVLLNITNYIKNDSNYNYCENLIDTFYSVNNNDENIYDLLNHLNMVSYSHVSTMYLSYKDPIDDYTLQRNVNTVRIQKADLKYRDFVAFTKYKKGILIFYFYPDSDSRNLLKNWQLLLSDLNIEKSKFNIGLNDTLLPVLKTDIAIERAIHANAICCRRDCRQLLFTSLGLNNFSLDISRSAYSKEYLRELYNKLSEIDDSKNSQLIETICAYANSHFQIDKTGEALFQHPNTVRYRVNKMKNIFGIDDDFSFQVIAMLLNEMICNKPTSN